MASMGSNRRFCFMLAASLFIRRRKTRGRKGAAKGAAHANARIAPAVAAPLFRKGALGRCGRAQARAVGRGDRTQVGSFAMLPGTVGKEAPDHSAGDVIAFCGGSWRSTASVVNNALSCTGFPAAMVSTVTGTETAADTYDVFGVFVYAGFRGRRAAGRTVIAVARPPPSSRSA